MPLFVYLSSHLDSEAGSWSVSLRSPTLSILMEEFMVFSKVLEDYDRVTLCPLTSVLEEFGNLSGLFVNPSKSQLLLSKSAATTISDLLSVLNFHLGSLPVTYLGLPMVSSKLFVSDCRSLLLKVDRRISGWGSLQLSFAARTQLIKSVLCSLSVYWSSAFVLPKTVIHCLEKKLRKFLWQGNSSSGYAKVPWHQVCQPRECGGLSIPDLLGLNKALMCKHLWDFLTRKESSIWVNWVWRFRLHKRSIWDQRQCNSTWAWRKLIKLLPLIQPKLRFHIGNGDTIWLWTDPWHSLGPLVLVSSGSCLPKRPSSHWPSIRFQTLFRYSRHELAMALYLITSPPNYSRRAPAHSRRQCLSLLRSRVKFPWPHTHWSLGVVWALVKFIGRHMINAAYRAALASSVYHIWQERNNRRFTGLSSTPESVAAFVADQIRLRILSDNLPRSLQSVVVYRTWHIPWV
ncbi:UNVERIFIED_CONTAM: hypothetical protein Sradi_7192800 [Sesamum radiatum]|uniref:Uncharacterized protein n=1 Tax=Sesamum radiatum TaxID=300843 RepID=A0AAW2ISF2_SESRA